MSARYLRPLLFVVSALFAQGLFAQVTLLEWDMSGVDQSTVTLTAGTVATNISSTSPSGVLSRGAGASLPGSTGSNNFGASGFDSASLAAAITANDFFSFSITVNSGFTMSLTNLEFNMQRTSGGPTNAAVMSSVGGFTDGSEVSSYTVSSATGGGDQSIVLSSMSNLSGTVEFRVYGWGGGGGTTDKFRFRNLSSGDLEITGTTASAVPEPASFASLMGIFALGFIKFRRRR